MPDDVLSQLQRLLAAAGAAAPAASQAYPGMAQSAGLPGAWPGLPVFWNRLPPEGIPAQEPWRLGGDNVVSPRPGLGMNAAGIYGRGGALPAPADNRDTVVPAGNAGVNLNALIRLLQQVGIGPAQPAAASPFNLTALPR